MKGSIYYKVTPQIIKTAERLGIKGDKDEEPPIPTRENMDKYIRIIQQSKESNNAQSMKDNKITRIIQKV